MKIYFKPEGGFGFFPGLNTPLELNSDTLPAEEAAHVKQLINEAGFFTLPSQPETPAQGADMKTYMIKIEDSAREHWIQVSDHNADPCLQDLVSYLSNKQREYCVR
ncbi:protealysin inhibitor emfourin [Pontibacter chitinilyticus]|uniref:protealysin inhibitor emfourin n=1 Tax=Pontibacter chitinilyticus TaxID=2674989 RepID=UPI00321A1D50